MNLIRILYVEVVVLRSKMNHFFEQRDSHAKRKFIKLDNLAAKEEYTS